MAESSHSDDTSIFVVPMEESMVLGSSVNSLASFVDAEIVSKPPRPFLAVRGTHFVTQHREEDDQNINKDDSRTSTEAVAGAETIDFDFKVDCSEIRRLQTVEAFLQDDTLSKSSAENKSSPESLLMESMNNNTAETVANPVPRLNRQQLEALCSCFLAASGYPSKILTIHKNTSPRHTDNDTVELFIHELAMEIYYAGHVTVATHSGDTVTKLVLGSSGQESLDPSSSSEKTLHLAIHVNWVYQWPINKFRLKHNHETDTTPSPLRSIPSSDEDNQEQGNATPSLYDPNFGQPVTYDPNGYGLHGSGSSPFGTWNMSWFFRIQHAMLDRVCNRAWVLPGQKVKGWPKDRAGRENSTGQTIVAHQPGSTPVYQRHVQKWGSD
ncbi:hypothetical protein L228DRAFT_250237, partial [Xylona heveae TC161]